MAMQGSKTHDGIFVSWNVYHITGVPPVPQTLAFFPTAGSSVQLLLGVKSNVAGSAGDITNLKVYTNRTNLESAIGSLTLKKESFSTVMSGSDHPDAGFSELPTVAVYDNYIYIGLRFVVTLRSGAVITIDQPSIGFINSSMSNTPTITEFSARRCDASGNLSDEGQYIRTAIKGDIAPGMGWTPSDHTLRVGYRLQGSTGAFAWINKTGFAANININERLNTGAVFAPGSAYEIRCELINNQRSITAHAAAVLPKAFANFHLSGSGYGVAVGQYSTATEQNPLFECAHPAHFYGGIRQLDYSAERMDTGAKWIDGKPIYRKVLQFAFSGSTTLTTLSLGDSIEMLVVLRGVYVLKGGSAIPIPRAHNSAMASQVDLYATNIGGASNVGVRRGSSVGDGSGCVIVEYTLAG